MRLNPYHPERFWNHLGRALYSAQSYGEAMEAFSRISKPDYTHHAFLAACSAQLGNTTAAAAHAREVLSREPTFSIDGHLQTLHYKEVGDQQHYREGLVKAGLP